MAVKASRKSESERRASQETTEHFHPTRRSENANYNLVSDKGYKRALDAMNMGYRLYPKTRAGVYECPRRGCDVADEMTFEELADPPVHWHPRYRSRLKGGVWLDESVSPKAYRLPSDAEYMASVLYPKTWRGIHRCDSLDCKVVEQPRKVPWRKPKRKRTARRAQG